MDLRQLTEKAIEHEARIAAHDEELKTLFNQQKNIEKLADSTRELAQSVKGLGRPCRRRRRTAGHDRGRGTEENVCGVADHRLCAVRRRIDLYRHTCIGGLKRPDNFSPGPLWKHMHTWGRSAKQGGLNAPRFLFMSIRQLKSPGAATPERKGAHMYMLKRLSGTWYANGQAMPKTCQPPQKRRSLY